ncbi:MmcQ/YjbR family DNA-binding protein [Paracoccus pacificus]|uniref:MmcQ/YjbR family DNA-binding protein n=1 Tax=Paracoccus pacificus TaxID=1463598 RepID=A0ABW4R890_9RHOB
MSRESVNAMCSALPGSENSDPWGGGHDCWKVGGKMFAVIGAMDERLSVKTDSPETAEMLIDAGVGQRARYLHKSWIAMPLDADPDELRHRILASYRLIRDKLPKKLQAGLDPA